jgi:RND superfamily putative drug exporter
MLMVGMSVLSGAAIAASIAVLLPMLAAQTLLPAINGLLGRRVLTRRQRKALEAGQTNAPEASARWARCAEHVQSHRLSFGIGALAVMIALAIPATSMRLGTASYGIDPRHRRRGDRDPRRRSRTDGGSPGVTLAHHHTR